MTVADLPLWAQPRERYRVPPAAPGSATSEAAALNITPRAPKMRERVMVFVQVRGFFGATRQEIADALGMRLSTVCGRVAELLERQQIVATTRRRESREVLVAMEAEQHGCEAVSKA